VESSADTEAGIYLCALALSLIIELPTVTKR
jgi:hypothetical protein